MTTKIVYKNIDGLHPLRVYTQARGGELRAQGLILPGQTAELLVDAANDLRVALELDDGAEVLLPIQNPLHTITPRTLRLKTSKLKGKNWGEPTHADFIPAREAKSVTLRGPARLEISEMPT
jgi:hypothetical protein